MKKKYLACFIMAILLSFSTVITGCNKKQVDENNLVVYNFGGDDITYAEYYIYAKTIEEDYCKVYGNGVWELELNTDDGNSSVKDITIKDIVSDINRVKVLNAHSAELNISLTDSEISEIEEIADKFYKGLTEEDIKESGISNQLVKAVIKENLVANKVYEHVLEDYDFEISDEEARMISFYDMVFECYKVEKDGSIKEYSEEEKQKQLDKANEALTSLAEDEDTTYEKLVDKYNLQYASSYTMSKSQITEEYGESVASKILELADGEVSVVVETQYGYHIFKMLKSNDEELTKENKANIVRSKQKEYFSGMFDTWVKDYDPSFDFDKQINRKLAEKIWQS
ncbi:MAG: peptidyl-prolyl cis-trans isomerase [Lachnospiraceae bacterium]|nr:peptidyl-prolyl cis-trans isomerase [Lachnospiraceae bacterium]